MMPRRPLNISRLAAARTLVSGPVTSRASTFVRLALAAVMLAAYGVLIWAIIKSVQAGLS